MNAAASVSFEFCIKRAKVASIMCQYGAMDGMPSCANAKINNALYRDTYGWDGFLVSDCDAVADFASHLNITTDAQAAAYGIKGGLDVDCGTSYASITDAVKQGLVSETAVRTAAERFLAKQIALGALETTPFDRVGPAVVDSAEHRKLALDAAAQSLVLLRNEKVVSHAGSAPLLPFSADAKLVFIGPHTTSTVDLLGNYHGVILQVLIRSIADVATQRGLRFSTAVRGWTAVTLASNISWSGGSSSDVRSRPSPSSLVVSPRNSTAMSASPTPAALSAMEKRRPRWVATSAMERLRTCRFTPW